MASNGKTVIQFPWLIRLILIANGLVLLLGTILAALAPIGLKWLGFLAAGLAGFCTFVIFYFFRDPDRKCQAKADEILSPADGMILAVETVREERFLKQTATRIAIFMHLGNVHIQRIPSDGKLVWTEHQPGKFRAILHRKAKEENEQLWYGFKQADRSFTLVQIAGMFARRTVSWLELNQFCRRGERLGLIALGSEVDLYLPPRTSVLVKPGQKVLAGETVIGSW